jgi:PBSX family phage terminase large subunit
LLADTTTKIFGLISGFGAGKTYVACRKAIQLAYLNAGHDGIITEPTFPLLRDIFIPEMKKALEDWGVPYRFNSSNSIFTLDINGVDTKVLCMSMENVERLIGVNAAWIICDEFDTTKQELAYKAFIKLLGRLRAGSVRQFVITTTPEGFRAAYRIFVKEADSSKKLIQAKTTDNKYLPADFIDTLKSQYPANLLDAYMNGNFVNLVSGTVYKYFTRLTHSSNEELKDGDTLLIGQDFNVDACISIVMVQRGDKIIAVDEIVSYDTKAIIFNLKDRYPNNRIEIYPDASGDNRKTNASETDIQMLQQAGFSVYVNSTNPAIKDRVNIVNNMFDKNRLLININKCPKLTEALEQQAYNERGEPEKQNTHPANDDYNDALGYCIAYKFPIVTYVPITGGFNR